MSNPVERLAAALSERYRIESQLGAGGMATVYLAEDLKHHRRVAVKVLRPELAAVLGAERFLKEIEVTANLQHPHILPLHDSGEADSFLYYVMPYVEGESLREKLNRDKQFGVEETVEIAKGVAAALDYAHRQGVIHRDIKPENILLHDGQPVVADFGIALAVSAAAGSRMTETGLSLGTPYYMSPEQATADRDITGRSDIYSLACVTYEMLAGEPPYTGPTVQAVLAKVITEKPRWLTVQRDTVPPHLDAAVRKALEKLPADRFATAKQFADALTDARLAPVTARVETAAEPERRRSIRRAALPWGLIGALTVTVIVLALMQMGQPPTGIRETIRFVVRLPPTQELNRDVPQLALSRDGTRLAISVHGGGVVLRDLADPGVQLLVSGTDELNPFFSPDGKSVAFLSDLEQQLRRVSLGGGSPTRIAGDVALLFGGTWGPGDTIVYAPRVSGGLWMVSAEGGSPEQLTVPDPSTGELGHWYPQILPGGKKVLFSTYRSPIDSARIEVLDLETRKRTVVVTGGVFGRYVPTGHIVYMRYETMWAVPFDLDRLRRTGSRELLLEGVAYSAPDAEGGFAISDNGTLAYIKASVWDVERTMVWVDRDGTERPVIDAWGRYGVPAISPDGGRVAFMRSAQGKSDIWVYDLARGGSPSRVTRSDRLVRGALWTRDGTRLIYHVEQTHFDLFWRDWEASAPEQMLLMSDVDKNPSSISPDRRELAFTVTDETRDIWLMPLEGARTPHVFRATEHNELHPVFSPDGRWIAYRSNESGDDEIWLQSYPDTSGGRHQITTDGGQGPRWGSAGELFYHNDAKLMAVQIDLASGLPGTPIVLFDAPYVYEDGPYVNYDVTPDGHTFLMVKPRPGVERRDVVVVLNWFEELKRKMPEGTN